MTFSPPPSLGRECRAIYAMIFPGRAVPSDLEARYIKAHDDLSIPTEGPEQRLITCCLDQDRDLEAVEIWLRSRAQTNLLTVKCRLVACLAETSPGHYELFCNQRRIPWVWVGLCGVGYCLRALYKRAKGRLHARQCSL